MTTPDGEQVMAMIAGIAAKNGPRTAEELAHSVIAASVAWLAVSRGHEYAAHILYGLADQEAVRRRPQPDAVR